MQHFSREIFGPIAFVDAVRSRSNLETRLYIALWKLEYWPDSPNLCSHRFAISMFEEFRTKDLLATVLLKHL